MQDDAGATQRAARSRQEDGLVHPDSQPHLLASHGALVQTPPRGHGVLELHVSPERVTRLLITCITVLTVMNLVAITVVEILDVAALTYESDVIQLVNFDYERNLPTWNQGTMVAICGVLLLLIGTEHRQNGRMRDSAHWVFLAATFFGISLDEALAVHEQWMIPVRSAFGISSGLLYFAWVIPAGAFLTLLAISLVPFLRSLPTETRRQFLAAGTIFVGGAIGFEMIAGAYVSRDGGGDTVFYKLLATVEELLEMVGIIAFLRAILISMARGEGTTRISSLTLPAR